MYKRKLHTSGSVATVCIILIYLLFAAGIVVTVRNRRKADQTSVNG